MKAHNPIRRFETTLCETLSALERMLVRVAVFGIFVVGVYVITVRLMHW